MAKQVQLADPVHLRVAVLASLLEKREDRQVTMSEAVDRAVSAWWAQERAEAEAGR